MTITWMSTWKLGSMVRINGLFHLLINWVFLGVVNPLILTIDPNFQRDIQVVSNFLQFCNGRFSSTARTVQAIMATSSSSANGKTFVEKTSAFVFFLQLLGF